MGHALCSFFLLIVCLRRGDYFGWETADILGNRRSVVEGREKAEHKGVAYFATRRPWNLDHLTAGGGRRADCQDIQFWGGTMPSQ